MPSIPKPPLDELEKFGLGQFARWLSQLHKDSLKKTFAIHQELSPSEIPAASGNVQDFTVKGLTVDDAVTVIKPTHTTYILLLQAYCNTNDVLSIVFLNTSPTTDITPPTETYKIIATRIGL